MDRDAPFGEGPERRSGATGSCRSRAVVVDRSLRASLVLATAPSCSRSCCCPSSRCSCVCRPASCSRRSGATRLSTRFASRPRRTPSRWPRSSASGRPRRTGSRRRRGVLRDVLVTLVELPLVLPPAVAGIGLLVAFGRAGLLGEQVEALGIDIAFTKVSVVLAVTFVASPFYLRTAIAAFEAVDPTLPAAARTLGAGRGPRLPARHAPARARRSRRRRGARLCPRPGRVRGDDHVRRLAPGSDADAFAGDLRAVRRRLRRRSRDRRAPHRVSAGFPPLRRAHHQWRSGSSQLTLFAASTRRRPDRARAGRGRSPSVGSWRRQDHCAARRGRPARRSRGLVSLSRRGSARHRRGVDVRRSIGGSAICFRSTRSSRISTSCATCASAPVTRAGGRAARAVPDRPARSNARTASSPAASGSGSRSPGRWPRPRPCSCSTSRSRRSTPYARRASARSCGSCSTQLRPAHDRRHARLRGCGDARPPRRRHQLRRDPAARQPRRARLPPGERLRRRLHRRDAAPGPGRRDAERADQSLARERAFPLERRRGARLRERGRLPMGGVARFGRARRLPYEPRPRRRALDRADGESRARAASAPLSPRSRPSRPSGSTSRSARP